MAAKDKSASFVFHGTYTEIIPFQKYFIEDGRKVEIFLMKLTKILPKFSSVSNLNKLML
jgi:hypothetical protein